MKGLDAATDTQASDVLRKDLTDVGQRQVDKVFQFGAIPFALISRGQ